MFSQKTTTTAQKQLLPSVVASVAGTSKRPDPPRGVSAVGGSRKLVVTWEPPADTSGILGFRVYKDTESQFYGSCDSKTRRMDVNVTTSATPTPSAVYVSSFTSLGESEKIQAIGTPTTEAGAVPDPTPSTEVGDPIIRNAKQSRLLYGP